MTSTIRRRAYAPASIGNFAAGFDLMGAALAPLDGSLWGDVVGAEPADEPALTVSGSYAGVLPADPRQNLVLRTYELFRKELRGRGIEVPALAFHLEKNLPRCSGLGSSASSVAATLAVCRPCWTSRSPPPRSGPWPAAPRPWSPARRTWTTSSPVSPAAFSSWWRSATASPTRGRSPGPRIWCW